MAIFSRKKKKKKKKKKGNRHNKKPPTNPALTVAFPPAEKSPISTDPPRWIAYANSPSGTSLPREKKKSKKKRKGWLFVHYSKICYTTLRIQF
jgi:hypothetical protein